MADMNVYDECCRLCRKSEAELLDVFGACVFERDIVERIRTIFDVEIVRSDCITKKICKQCFYLTNSVYEQRITAIRNNLFLKEEYEKSHPNEKSKPTPIEPATSKDSDSDSDWETIQATRCDSDSESDPETLQAIRRTSRSRATCQMGSGNPDITQDMFLKSLRLTNVNVYNQYHPSVQRIMKQYPNLIIPTVCSSLNMEAHVKIDPRVCDEQMKTALGKWVFYREGARKSTYSFEHRLDMGGKRRRRHSEKVELRSAKKICTASPDTGIPEEVHETVASVGADDDDNLLMSIGLEIKTYICQTCNEIFEHPRHLQNHQRTAHRASRRCYQCDKRYSTVEELVHHNISTHMTKSIEQERDELNAMFDTVTDALQNDGADAEPIISITDMLAGSKFTARKHTNGCLMSNISGTPVMGEDEDTNLPSNPVEPDVSVAPPEAKDAILVPTATEEIVVLSDDEDADMTIVSNTDKEKPPAQPPAPKDTADSIMTISDDESVVDKATSSTSKSAPTEEKSVSSIAKTIWNSIKASVAADSTTNSEQPFQKLFALSDTLSNTRNLASNTPEVENYNGDLLLENVPTEYATPVYASLREQSHIEKLFKKLIPKNTVPAGAAREEAWLFLNFKRLIQGNFIPLQFCYKKDNAFEMEFVPNPSPTLKKVRWDSWNAGAKIDVKTCVKDKKTLKGSLKKKVTQRAPETTETPSQPDRLSETVNPIQPLVPSLPLINEQKEQRESVIQPLDNMITQLYEPVNTSSPITNIPPNTSDLILQPIMMTPVSQNQGLFIPNSMLTTTQSQVVCSPMISNIPPINDMIMPESHIIGKLELVPGQFVINGNFCQPTMTQQFGQQANVNIQNFVAISHPSGSTTTTVTETVSVPTQTVATESPKPTIRIKDISELTGTSKKPTVNESDMRVNHFNMYWETLTKYVNSTPNTNVENFNPGDEYHQIM